MISVIIPAYNCRDTISRCLNSLISQTIFPKFEIIVIDDGSTDDTLKIIKKYSCQYSNIKAIRKKNGGASSARNCGIKHCTGKYVTFCDSDDTLDPDFLEKIQEGFMKPDIDIVFCSYKKINKNTVKIFRFKRGEIKTRKKLIKRFVKRTIPTNVCAKAYKTEILTRNNIGFREDVVIGEDLLFLYEYLLFAKSGVVIDCNGYNYYHNDSSVMNAGRDELFYDCVRASEEIARRRNYDKVGKAILLYERCKYLEYVGCCKAKKSRWVRRCVNKERVIDYVSLLTFKQLLYVFLVKYFEGIIAMRRREK